MQLCSIVLSPENFERLRTQLSSFLHLFRFFAVK
nr:MAG TPA: hypothetical protein [Caudoviricetes sp.]